MKNPLFLICFVLLALVFNSCKSDDELLSPVSIGEEEFSLYVDQKIIYVESEDTTRKFEYKEYCNSHMYNARGARYMKNPSNWLDAYGIFVDKAFPLTDKDYYSHIYIRRDGSEKIIFPRIDVTLTDAAPETIENASGNVLEFIGYKNGNSEANVCRFSCRVKSSSEVIGLCNSLLKNESVKKAVPETNRHDNFPPWVQFNTYYGNQYYLHNTGQNGGTIGADINVESAWAIVRGNPNITVAIIDDGVDTTHEDLQGVLLEGYTAGDSTAKGHSKREYSLGHGTSCAGIVGAVDNEIGIKGVASGVKILPVDILTRANNLQERADAIIWASQRADVLSLSMGNYYSSDTIAAAIEYARVNGRGGKGCVIVCAAGDNNQGSGIVFPANMDNVLAVGAVDKNKNHCSYSPTGFGLNLVAIGGNLDIYTLSNMKLGYVQGADTHAKYTPQFGGTSAACPQVAGVAALMLSINPGLTELQVREKLQNTAIDLGTSGRDVVYGYGLVDAGAAVASAKPNWAIQGVTYIQDSARYIVSSLPQELTLEWRTSGTCYVSSQPQYNTAIIKKYNGAPSSGNIWAIVKHGDVPLDTLILSLSNVNPNVYSGTYRQDGCLFYGKYHQPIPTKPLNPNVSYFVHQGCRVYLTSNYFNNATATYTGLTPDDWYKSGSQIQFTLPYGSGGIPFVIHVGSYYFTFFTVSNNGEVTQNNLDIQSLGDDYLLSIVPNEDWISTESALGSKVNVDKTMTRAETSWTLEIYNMNDGTPVLKTDIQGNAFALSTAGWKQGMYVVRATVGDDVLNAKIYVK